ncbi:hypothetical protein [Geodermatophilus sp. SYSU D00700]
MSIPPAVTEPTSATAPEPPGLPRVIQPVTADACTHATVPGAPVGAAPGMSLTRPHDPALCEGRGCSLHHPSAHHMRTWPRVWREFYGFSDRVCDHGVGHPDPDDVVHLQSVGGATTAHPCDGCCTAPLRDAR